MKSISETTNKFLKEYFPHIKVKKNNDIVIINPLTKDLMKVPSNLYPLYNKKTLKVFTYMDTQYLKQDTKIAEIFNQLKFKTGFCYQNTEDMEKAFKQHNIKDVKTYVGWLLIGDGLVHHCWLVYNETYVLDPGITLIQDIVQERILEEKADLERSREIYLEVYKETKDTPNSQLCTFGKVAPFAIYIGTECKPSLGREIFNKLASDFPNHPAYQNGGMNAHGASTLQKMIDEEDSK